MENERTCGATENGVECDERATYICDTCGAMLCDDHVVILHITCMDDMSPRCRDTTCEHERTCDVCGETGDATCFNGSGICADENAVDEQCEYGQCDERATEICDTCGAMICDAHAVTGKMITVTETDLQIPYVYCRKFACVNGMKTIDIVPYITCA